VTPQVPAANNSGQDIKAELAALVRNFHQDADANAARIRELLHSDRQEFYAGAVEILRSPDPLPGSPFLIATLAGNNLLLQVLSEPTLTREQATALAKSAASTCSMLDLTLAKHLAEGLFSGTTVTSGDLQRLMEILCEVSNGTPVVEALNALAREADPFLQSKAVLMIGRANRNIKWVQQHLADPDARVRANAVEAMWGVDTEEARGLLRLAAQHRNNRVAGNALLGLYQLGESSVFPAILKMAERDTPRFRATAAWVMGQTGDPRFTRALAGLLSENDDMVRKRAFAALGQIRTARALSRQGPEWRLRAECQGAPRNGWCNVRAQVTSLDGSERIHLRATNFILSEGALEVVNYRVDERPACDTRLAFIFPRQTNAAESKFVAAALEALRSKQPGESWCVVPYGPAPPKQKELISASNPKRLFVPYGPAADGAGGGGAGTPAEGHAAPVVFGADPESIREKLLAPLPAAESMDFWEAILRTVQTLRDGSRGQKHVLIYNPRENGAPPDYQRIAAAAWQANTSVHAIAEAACPSVEKLVRRTGGTLRVVSNEAEAAEALKQAYFELTAQYVIRYQPAAEGADSLTIRVHSPAGWAEASINVPRRAM
jgi:HEAT repeats